MSVPLLCSVSTRKKKKNGFLTLFQHDCLVFLFPTYDAPHYKYGYQILAMFGVLTIGSSFVLQWQDNREK